MRKVYEKKETKLIRKFQAVLKRNYRNLTEINFNCHSREFMNCEFVLKDIHYRLEAVALSKLSPPISIFWRIYKGRANAGHCRNIPVEYGLLLYKKELKSFVEKLEISSIDWVIFGKQTGSKVIWIYDDELNKVESFEWDSLFALFWRKQIY